MSYMTHFIAALLFSPTFAAANEGVQDLPKWAAKSRIHGEQRVKAITKIELQLRQMSEKNKDAHRAYELLVNEASIVEPLGADANGSDAFRFLVAAKVKKKKWFGVLPLFADDAKLSKILKEFIDAKPPAYAGIHPDAPIVILRIDGPDSPNRIRSYIIGINSKAHQ